MTRDASGRSTQTNSNPALQLPYKVTQHRPTPGASFLSGPHQPFHSRVDNLRVAQCPMRSPCPTPVISRVPSAPIEDPRRRRRRRQLFDKICAKPDVVLLTERPHNVPHARVGTMIPVSYAAQHADVVGAHVQDAAAPVRQQPARGGVEQREGRAVLFV